MTNDITHLRMMSRAYIRQEVSGTIRNHQESDWAGGREGADGLHVAARRPRRSSGYETALDALGRSRSAAGSRKVTRRAVPGALTEPRAVGIKWSMMRWLHRAAGRSWPAVTVMLASLLFAQPGFSLGVSAAWAGSADACCNRTCPCDEVAEAGDDAHRDHDESSSPEDGSGEQCPSGCDDCNCCPGAVVAVAPSLAPCPESPPDGTVLNAPPDEPASGIPGRIFRPPEPSLI